MNENNGIVLSGSHNCSCPKCGADDVTPIGKGDELIEWYRCPNCGPSVTELDILRTKLAAAEMQSAQRRDRLATMGPKYGEALHQIKILKQCVSELETEVIRVAQVAGVLADENDSLQSELDALHSTNDVGQGSSH